MKSVLFDECLAKLPDLSTQVVVVTGTTSGTGFWFSVAVLKKKVKALFVLNRNSAKLEAALKLLRDEVLDGSELIPITCDLQSFESVREAAEQINERAAKLGGVTVIANNAGLGGQKDHRTKDGYDVSMQTNHLSHALLTKMLWPSLKMALENNMEVRVCQHSAAIIRAVSYGPLLEANFRKSEPGTLNGDSLAKGWRRYYFTKLANAQFALAFHRNLVENGFNVSKIKSICCDPGVSPTGFGANMVSNRGWFGAFGNWLMTNVMMKFMLKTQSPQDASVPLLHSCFSSEVSSGDYWGPKEITRGEPIRRISEGKLDQALEKDEVNVISIEQLDDCWKWTEEAVGKIID